MRLDYLLYALAVVLFILTGIVLAYQSQMKELWTVATFVLGLLFLALGYTQRPKVMTASTVTLDIPSVPSTIMEEKIETAEEVSPPSVELTEVKGIGEKRKEQLKSVGIHSVEELGAASAEELATKLDVSPKRTKTWIEDAKKLVKE